MLGGVQGLLDPYLIKRGRVASGTKDNASPNHHPVRKGICGYPQLRRDEMCDEAWKDSTRDADTIA